jgi:hypothetical protein
MTAIPSPDNLIPDPINHVTAAIDAAVAAQGRESDWGGVPMGSAAHACDRAIWYALRWAHQPEQPNGKRKRVFETGRLYEERLIRYLRLAGVEVEDLDPSTGKQWAVSLANGWLRGKADGRAINVPTAERTEHVVECKSTKAADFRAIVKHGLQKAKPEHWTQCQLYMHGLGLSRCLYICANKDTDEIWTERVQYDPVAAAQTEARIERIVAAQQPPARAFDKADGYPCNVCPAGDMCWRSAWARVNCRTCLHVELAPDNQVRCTLKSVHLDWKAQQAGCPDHRYVPGLVPGEQVDVLDGDLIVYRMADGAEWIDGRRE